MYNHAPDNYECPFCRIVRNSRENITTADSDMICQTEMVTAFLALGRWPKNPFNVLVVPNRHIENIYDLSTDFAVPFHRMNRAIALTLKRLYACEGISLRQHNEPAGNQEVWHYHVHLTPRFIGDNFYGSRMIPFPETERLAEAKRIREYIRTHQDELFAV